MKSDLVVIGAGTGGLRTAITAANNGLKVTLIGTDPLGGTCLNNGCIPTKALLHSAGLYREIQGASEFGIDATAKVNFPAIMKRVRGIVAQGRSHIDPRLPHIKNLDFIKGRAEFVGKNVVQVGRRRVHGENFIISTGTRPFIPPVPGLREVDYLTNENVLALDKMPSSMVIIGGGYIACEFATFFASIGVSVTILEVAPSILTVLDEDAREVVRQSLEELGVRILTGVATTKVTQSNSGFTCTLSGAPLSFVRSEHLLVACGRIPNTENLGCDKASIKLSGRGFVDVNSALRTSNKHCYAIGDVNGKALFAHAAKREGWQVLEQIILSKSQRRQISTVPWAVFTHPSVAGVGKSEYQLKQSKTEYEVMRASFSRCGKAKIIGQEMGFVKVMHSEGRLLGVMIVGPDADNLIHEFVPLMHAGTNAMSLLKKTIHVHPTLAEVNEALK